MLIILSLGFFWVGIHWEQRAHRNSIGYDEASSHACCCLETILSTDTESMISANMRAGRGYNPVLVGKKQEQQKFKAILSCIGS